MSEGIVPIPAGFPILLREINARIQHAQTRATLSANAELVRLYWDIGRLIDERQRQKGWSAAVIPRLAAPLKNELPELKGFSERNIDLMIQFYREYPDPVAIVPPVAAQSLAPPISQPPVAKLSAGEEVQPVVAKMPNSTFWAIPWAHHVTFMQKVKDIGARLWYMQQTLASGWSRNVLLAMIQSQAHRRQGKAITNFDRLLPPPACACLPAASRDAAQTGPHADRPQSDLARQTLKDPYIFDFLTLDAPFHERELETHLLRELERFLLELGQGFAFVGRQVRLDVGESDFYVDLLFYHLKLRCFVVIDLKTGEFKPEYAGKMNFYLSVVDDRLRHAHDSPSIGLILCQDKNHIVAEYALRDMNKPIGVSAYELTRALPPSLRSALPTVDEIEAELSESAARQRPNPARPVETRRAKPSPPAKKKPSRKGRRT